MVILSTISPLPVEYTSSFPSTRNPPNPLGSTSVRGTDYLRSGRLRTRYGSITGPEESS